MTPELNQEYSGPDENSIIKEMTELTVREMRHSNGHVLRGQHAKATGCVEAELRIADNVPPELRHGVFREAGRMFRAIVRFSNSREKLEHDGEPSARGMAIKLLDVEGPRAMSGDNENTQDFLMVNHPVFPFATPAEYLETMRRKAVPVVGGIWALLTLEPREAEIRREILAHKVASPLDIDYWRGSPYRLGPAGAGGRAVKYKATSRQARTAPTPDDPEALPHDYLTQALARDLRVQDAAFDFSVQVQTDPVAMPIEDVSVAWDEEISAPKKVATLHIPRQTVDPLGDLAIKCEKMSFNPWHALAEHRPLGGINRLRLAVYQASFTARAHGHGER
jgi:catalase